MADKAKAELKKQEEVSVERISEISTKIREAVRAALPAPPEQHFTIMVPGKVINFNEYTAGFDEDGSASTAILPAVTELNNAILCDDMPALGTVQLGPTGRSVSRSYAATLGKLVAKGATVGVEVTDPNNLTDAEKKYKKAMEWLITEDPRNPGKTHLDTYIQKQKAYTAAEEKRIKKFDEAYERLTADPRQTVAQKRAAYDTWVRENARKLKNEVEATYKDWVVHGRKEEAEYWFSIVDNDSAMSRVEASKEAMRNAVVTDSDGVVSYPTVRLSPSNWARIAQKKARAGAAADGTKTESQLNWEISILRKRNRMLETMKENPPKLTQASTNTQETDDDKKAVRDAMKDFMASKNAYDEANRANAKDKKGNSEEAKKQTKELSDDLEKKRESLRTALEDYDEKNNERLKAVGLAALDELFTRSANNLQSDIDANDEKIKQLEDERKEIMTKKLGSASDIVASEVGLPALPQDKAAPATAPAGNTTATTGQSEEEYFTPITVEIASSYEATQASQSTTSYSASVSASAGLFSVSASMSHSKSAADAAAQMAKSSVKISLECMRVDISRSWLRPELFYDDDLTAAPGQHISPGPMKLAALVNDANYKNAPEDAKKQREKELQMYATFPMYPTAFLLAANVVLEISGETSAIQSHFDASSTSASASVGYGPFHASASYSHSDQHQNSTCETTASGCRITIKSPQIIGWISELVPALPRLPEPAPATTAAAQPRAITGTAGANTAQQSPPALAHTQGHTGGPGGEAHAEGA